MKTFAVQPLTTQVSAIGMGTMIFHPDTAERDFSLLDAFVEHNGTYIDTAEIYGAVEQYGFSEMVIGDWLSARPGMRDRIVLASKGLVTGYCADLHPGGASINPTSIHRAIEGSLGRLKTDHLDIWMFHRDDPTQPVGPLVDALDTEVHAGRIRGYGASNWTTARMQQAIEYARLHGKVPMIGASPNFSLAKANEPFWPNTVSTTQQDKRWFSDNRFLLVAWSALGRGFFARASPNDRSDPDLVRVFYSDDNFERKRRAEAFGEAKSMNMFEVALAYVINQDFPVVALNGAQTIEEVASSARAGNLVLTSAECDWLDLTSDFCPI